MSVLLFQIKKHGRKCGDAVIQTCRQMFCAGHNAAQNQKTEMLIHGENGRIRERNSYGNDPHPPKG